MAARRKVTRDEAWANLSLRVPHWPAVADLP
jgi:hypothetical protein